MEPSVSTTETILKTIGAFNIGAIIAVCIAFIWAIRGKKYDRKQELYKRVRIASANILHIWKELAHLQKLFRSHEPSDELMMSVPVLRKRFLKIDEKKITMLRESYDESLRNIKEVDSVLYYNLSDSFTPFNKTIEEVLIPIFKDRELSSKQKNNILIPLIDETVMEMQSEIKSLAKYLPRNERKRIDNVIDIHIKELTHPKQSQVPEFIVKQINLAFKFKHDVSGDEFVEFFNNPTVVWIYKKLFKTKIFNTIFKDMDIAKYVKLLASLRNINNASSINNVVIDEYELLKNISISQAEEERYFINNKAFYRLLLGIVYKKKGVVSWTILRDIVKYNSGQKSIRKEIEDYKSTSVLDELLRQAAKQNS
ncbi:MAG: hypothetical protein HY841_12300 [Bacteroidetes bacterium]|nr:hypothetical protein [Bacteroidota bacterium]